MSKIISFYLMSAKVETIVLASTSASPFIDLQERNASLLSNTYLLYAQVVSISLLISPKWE